MEADDTPMYTIAVGDAVAIQADSLWTWHDPAPTKPGTAFVGRTGFRTFGPMMGGSAVGRVTEFLEPPDDSVLPVMLRLTQGDGWEYLVELPDIAQITPLPAE